MEHFKIELRFSAETDMLTPQLERRLYALLKHKLDWIEPDTLDLEVMEREECGHRHQSGGYPGSKMNTPVNQGPVKVRL